MNAIYAHRLNVPLCSLLLVFVLKANAAVITTGIVEPTDPTTWAVGTNAFIGYSSAGSMTITEDSLVVCKNGYVGYDPHGVGQVTVDGIEAEWTVGEFLYLGQNGDGTLNIIGGGHVNVGKDTEVSSFPLSSSSITFDNGTLTTGGLISASDNLIGTGIINTHGLVCDYDIVFDATHGLSQTFVLNNNPSQNITVNLDVDGQGPMGVAHGGVGSMSISDGVVINCTGGYIGYQDGSCGVVSVDGDGSLWQNNGNLYVGNSGDGTLNITNGGSVSVQGATAVSRYSGSTGLVQFDNGTLSTNGLLCPGNSLIGTGTINTNGILSDVDLVFDATHGLSQTFKIDALPDQDITVNLDVADCFYLGVGHSGVGSMRISDGVVVESIYDTIGSRSGSIGTVTINGEGSKWVSHEWLCVGSSGNGTLSIKNGGTVECYDCIIGYGSNPDGSVVVDGASSFLEVDRYFRVDSGTLRIANNGSVVALRSMTIKYGFIEMASGGNLTVPGDAVGTIAGFLALIDHSPDIRYWDESLSQWRDIALGTPGEDYTLTHLLGPTREGRTVLTVIAPGPAEMVAGDLNCDGVVDVFDIDPFVIALVDSDAYTTAYPDCDLTSGDCNGDDTIDVFDIDPFVAILVGQG